MIYLVANANAMFSLLAHNPPSHEDLVTAASLGCNALGSLVDDREFRVYARELAGRRVDHAGDFDSITGRLEGSLDHYRYFMAEEERAMLQAGFYSSLADELARQGEQLIQRVREWDGDPEVLFVWVADLRDRACALAGELDQQMRQEVNRDQGWLFRAGGPIRRVMYVVAGGAVIVLNAVASLNLSDAGTAVSYAFGGALISQAIPPA